MHLKVLSAILLFLLFTVSATAQTDDKTVERTFSKRMNYGLQKKQQAPDNENIIRQQPVSKVMKEQYVPGQIIIKYKSFREARGGEILKEHENFISVFRNIFNREVKDSRPVYTKIVEGMISSGITEPELTRNIVSSLNSTVMPNKLPHLLSSQMPSNNFSRVIRISLNDEDAENILSNIENVKGSFASQGFEIEYAEPNYIYYTDSAPNDILYSDQWAHKMAGAEAAWDIEKGNRKIIIGVIDTGVDIYHPDLEANILPDKGYDFVDIDTSAYKKSDYVMYPGEDYTEEDNNPADFYGHGTHCAGIIGAEGNNGIGVSGVCQNISILPVRAGFAIKDIYGNEFGLLESTSIADAVNYAAGKGARIISMSFGSSTSSSTIKEAVDYAVSLGVVMIAAAGNELTDRKSYPAAYDNVISVAATDESDRKTYFSNFGSWVTLAAPGNNIMSTVPLKGGPCTNPYGYKSLSGTSMAAPYAAGIAGLVLSKNPSLSAAEVTWILKNCTDIPNEQGVYIGQGRVNVLKALKIEKPQICESPAVITSPVFNTLCTSDINISGTAGGNSYTLSYGPGIYPKSWETFTRGSNVSNGFLGTLSVKGIPDGRYTIKLTVNNSTGINETSVIVPVGNFSEMKTGWPQKIPSYYPGEYNFRENTFSVGDIDGDGKKEVVAIAGINTSCPDPNCDALYIYNCNGNLFRSSPLPYNGWSNSNPVLADLDGDGKKEIIAAGFDGFETPYFGKGFVQVLKYDGSQYPGWPKPLPIAPGYLAVGDIDMNGKPDIIAAAGGSVCSSCKDGGIIYAFNADGSDLKNFPFVLPKDYIPRSNLVIANIDNDPAPEVIFTAFNNPDPNNKPHYVYAVKGNGSFAAGFPVQFKDWGWPMAAGDINGDGINEIMTQSYPLNNAGMNTAWSLSNTSIYSSIVLADVNNDQKMEMLFGNGNGYAYLTNATGNCLPGWPKRVEAYTADGNHIVADVNGDSQPELIVLWDNNTTASTGQKPGIYAYNIDGTPAEGFPKFKDVLKITSAAVDDIDNDGLSDLVCMNSEDRQLLVINLQKKYDPAAGSWPARLQNLWNTASNPGEKARLLSDLNKFSIKEGDSLSVAVAPIPIDWKVYHTSVSTDTSAVAAFLKEGVLKISPAKFWNGSATIRVNVWNSFINETKTIIVEAGHVNHKPERSKPFPPVAIKEDTVSAVIVSNLYDYYKDSDKNDHMKFSCLSIDKGLDSVKINRTTLPSDSSSSVGAALVVYPSKYTHGNIRIRINVTDDSLATFSDTLMLTISHVNHKPVLASFKGWNMMEDDTLGVTLAASDVDNDSLIYAAKAETEKVHTIVQKNILTIIPEKYWSGTTGINLIVSDGSLIDTALITIKVNHINHAPSAFKLLTPKHNTVITLSANSKDTLYFTWEKPVDMDGDSLVFRFYSTDSLKMLNTGKVIDNKFAIPYSDVRKLMDSSKIKILKGSWTIIAYDIKDSTVSSSGKFNLEFSAEMTSVADLKIPKEFSLTQNYPNPFNASTKIKFGLPKDCFVEIDLHNMIGQHIGTIYKAELRAGYHELFINAGSYTSGIYFYTIKAADFTKTMKMMLIK